MLEVLNTIDHAVFSLNARERSTTLADGHSSGLTRVVHYATSWRRRASAGFSGVCIGRRPARRSGWTEASLPRRCEFRRLNPRGDRAGRAIPWAIVGVQCFRGRISGAGTSAYRQRRDPRAAIPSNLDTDSSHESVSPCGDRRHDSRVRSGRGRCANSDSTCEQPASAQPGCPLHEQLAEGPGGPAIPGAHEPAPTSQRPSPAGDELRSHRSAAAVLSTIAFLPATDDTSTSTTLFLSDRSGECASPIAKACAERLSVRHASVSRSSGELTHYRITKTPRRRSLRAPLLSPPFPAGYNR